MPPPTNSPETPEPDPALRARVARFAAENRDPGLTGDRRPFDIYYDAKGRPLTRHSQGFVLPECPVARPYIALWQNQRHCDTVTLDHHGWASYFARHDGRSIGQETWLQQDNHLQFETCLS
jgi:hypothetical protein